MRSAITLLGLLLIMILILPAGALGQKEIKIGAIYPLTGGAAAAACPVLRDARQPQHLGGRLESGSRTEYDHGKKQWDSEYGGCQNHTHFQGS